MRSSPPPNLPLTFRAIDNKRVEILADFRPSARYLYYVPLLPAGLETGLAAGFRRRESPRPCPTTTKTATTTINNPNCSETGASLTQKLELLLVRMPNSEPHDGEAILGHPGAYLLKNMLFTIVKELDWAMNIRIFSAEQQHRKANHACC